LSSGAVGIACVDGGHAYLASGCPQMLLVNDEWSGNNTVGSENGCGAGWRVGHNEGKVGVPALLKPRLGGAEAKAAGKNELGGIRHDIYYFIEQVERVVYRMRGIAVQV
jgi:hypothetical protein